MEEEKTIDATAIHAIHRAINVIHVKVKQFHLALEAYAILEVIVEAVLNQTPAPHAILHAITAMEDATRDVILDATVGRILIAPHAFLHV